MFWIFLSPRIRSGFWGDFIIISFGFALAIAEALSANIVTQHGSQYEIFLWCQFVQRSGSHGLNHFDTLPAAEKQIDFITADRLNAIIYVLAVQSTDGKLFIFFVRRIKNHVANTLLVFIHVVQKHFQFGRIGIARNHGMPVVKG